MEFEIFFVICFLLFVFWNFMTLDWVKGDCLLESTQNLFKLISLLHVISLTNMFMNAIF